MRLNIALWVMGLCAVTSGCQLARYTIRNSAFEITEDVTDCREHIRNHKLADVAWREVEGAEPGLNYSADYARGFKRGFEDFLYLGGDGHPPGFPPSRYWKYRFETAEGQLAADDWFAGFQRGAAVAQQRGVRERVLVRNSVYTGTQVHTPLISPSAAEPPAASERVTPPKPASGGAAPPEAIPLPEPKPAAEPSLPPLPPTDVPPPAPGPVTKPPSASDSQAPSEAAPAANQVQGPSSSPARTVETSRTAPKPSTTAAASAGQEPAEVALLTVPKKPEGPSPPPGPTAPAEPTRPAQPLTGSVPPQSGEGAVDRIPAALPGPEPHEPASHAAAASGDRKIASPHAGEAVAAGKPAVLPEAEPVQRPSHRPAEVGEWKIASPEMESHTPTKKKDVLADQPAVSDNNPSVPVSPAGDAEPGPSTRRDAVEQIVDLLQAAGDAGPGPSTRLVNSKRFPLPAELGSAGLAGMAGAALWYTKDGRAWMKYDGELPYLALSMIEVPDEGLYGFTCSKQSPRPGDLPQVWISVDITRPVVQLVGIGAGTGAEAGTLTVLWTATDPNLTPRPITISYAEKSSGPWIQIATGLPNTGRYLWKMPPGTPASVLIRVEAADGAGNVGAVETPAPVVDRRDRPHAAIVRITPAAQ